MFSSHDLQWNTSEVFPREVDMATDDVVTSSLIVSIDVMRLLFDKVICQDSRNNCS